jgi:hypothetical protein
VRVVHVPGLPARHTIEVRPVPGLEGTPVVWSVQPGEELAVPAPVRAEVATPPAGGPAAFDELRSLMREMRSEMRELRDSMEELRREVRALARSEIR